MRLLLACLLYLAAPFGYAESAPNLAQRVCALCHGRDGNSISPLFPRLAGQSAAYLEAQLKAFRSHARADPAAQAYMWGMSAQLDDDTIRALAAFYSERTLPAQHAPADLPSAGKAVYERTATAGAVVSCQTCHGARAEGAGLSPRLAGQHADYLSKQLTFFKNRLRTDNAVMLDVCSRLTAAEIEAVSAYAASK